MEIEDLQGVPLFSALPEGELATVAANLSRTWVQKGKHVAKEGDFAYKLCAVLSGTASVERDGERIAELSEGDVFGEMALPEDQRRNADVIAGDDLFLAVMLSWDFRSAMETCPVFKSKIDELIASRS